MTQAINKGVLIFVMVVSIACIYVESMIIAKHLKIRSDINEMKNVISEWESCGESLRSHH